jgi:WD40 repeat protein
MNKLPRPAGAWITPTRRAADGIIPMELSEKPSTKQIVPAGSQALAVRSSALVVRGLRDLARDSNWLIKKVFNGRSPHLAISPAGQLSAISPYQQHGARHGQQRVVLYDIELSVPTLALSVPGESSAPAADSPVAFAWSPTARYLVAAWGAWQAQLHCFDLHGKMLLGTFGDYRHFPHSIGWSETGKYFAAASAGGKAASLRLWQADRDAAAHHGPFAGSPASEVGVPNSVEPQQYGEEFAEEGAFRGYGRTAFSPNERLLAAVVEIQGDWADDSIAIFDVPSLQNQLAFGAQGHITDLTWTPDSRQIVYCAAGQAYRLEVESMFFEPLPFGAELCVCHPHLPLCVCFSSWLKNSAKGRLFLADLSRQTVFDEYAAEGVVDLQWSLDGSKAYAVTRDGMAYIYEPPLI